jgi:trehalose/maltose hydrolase-like predicted phosphorylase
MPGIGDGFTKHQRWDFEHTSPNHYPLLTHFHYFDLYRKQVVKQADVALALHLRGDAFMPEEKARDFAYYEALTVRDSSLSACTQASSRRKWATSSWRTTTSPKPLSWTSTTSSTTPATGCTSPR